MDNNTYITAHHLVKDYLPYFSADIVKYIVKIYGQNNIIVLDENKKEIYNGDVNEYFNKKITNQRVKKVIGATGATQPLCAHVPQTIIPNNSEPDIKVSRGYEKITKNRNESLAAFKKRRLAKKKNLKQTGLNRLFNWMGYTLF